MGKKILKRSLALGALMAFVITGNAWAADVSGKEYIGKEGTILTNSGSLNVENCKFINNYTEVHGGCISSNTGNLTINNCYFENNYSVKPYTDSASLNGSAILIEKGENTISNSTFKFHPHTVGSSSYKGVNGTVFIKNANVIFENCKFDYDADSYDEEYKYENAGNSTWNGNSATCIHAKYGAEVHFKGINYFKNCSNVSIFGAANAANMDTDAGELIFEEGSKTYFENNNLDFGMMRNVEIDNKALVVTQSTIYTKQMVLNGTGQLEVGGEKSASADIGTLSGTGGVIKFNSLNTNLVVSNNTNKNLKFEASSAVYEAIKGDIAKMDALIDEVDYAQEKGIFKDADTTLVVKIGNVEEVVANVVCFNEEYKDEVVDSDTMKRRTDKMAIQRDSVITRLTPENQAIGDKGLALKLHWRSHLSDLNKRMGELRDTNGELGVWTRMVRGENEYKGTKAQYNQYQLGYDERLSVDKRWIVGTAVTFADGDASYGYGSTEDKSTAFTVYGTKLNSDGSYVDLTARYEHMESDLKDALSGSGDYCANGMSVGAEFGKRFDQKDGAWIEPQVQLTYGTVDSAEFQLGDKTVRVGDMDSLIGRVGFRIGQDIEQGNIYARASYLYDFDGKTEATFSDGKYSRTVKEDLGGGWWEVGVGANINLSKATYIYADVEKTFGGEVDTNWQWNLGVRYSF